MTLFDTIATPAFAQEYIEHLKLAGRQEEKVTRMEAYLSSGDFLIDIDAVKNGTYTFSAPTVEKQFFSYGAKTRNIYRFPEREVNLQQLVAYAMHRYDGRFSGCLQYGLNRKVPWERALGKIPGYGQLFYFSTDMDRYSDSIDREILLSRLETFIDDDPQLLWYLSAYVGGRQCIRKGALCADRAAVPIGMPLCKFLNNLYLKELDDCIEPQAVFYARVTDRIVIGEFDPERLNTLSGQAMAVIQRLKLRVNEDETFVVKPGEAWTICDKTVAGESMDFCDKTVLQLKTRLIKEVAAGRESLAKLSRRMRGLLCVYRLESGGIYRGITQSFPYLTTDRTLRRLDHFIQSLFREVITGKRGNAKYECTYKELQSYGYTSFAGLYHRYHAKRRAAAGGGKRAKTE